MRVTVKCDGVTGTEPPAHLVRKLVGLCAIGGVLLAGMVFPVVAAIGVASNQAADTVVSGTADLADEQLPMATTVTDSRNLERLLSDLYVSPS